MRQFPKKVNPILGVPTNASMLSLLKEITCTVVLLVDMFDTVVSRVFKNGMI